MKLFADGADFDGIVEAAKDPEIKGFTTNPTLMRKAGITDYVKFSQNLIEYLYNKRPDTCVSLEVFADDNEGMIRQAREIDSWSFAYPVYVKIPVMNSKGESTEEVISVLSNEGIKLNVTAVFTIDQVRDIVKCITKDTPTIISVFAGRIADLGHNPIHIMEEAIQIIDAGLRNYPNKTTELLWASPREAYNYIEASNIGCDIITMTPDLIKKVKGFRSKSLEQFSKETVQMFYNDAVASGFKI
jgi:transaldolase